jgi:hypothetical protein
MKWTAEALSKLSIMKHFEVSTAHISFDDHLKLRSAATYTYGKDVRHLPEALWPLIVHDYKEGYWVHQLRPDPYETMVAPLRELRKVGFSNAFLRLLLLADALECWWVRLDCDGPIYDELRKFEWP